MNKGPTNGQAADAKLKEIRGREVSGRKGLDGFRETWFKTGI